MMTVAPETGQEELRCKRFVRVVRRITERRLPPLGCQNKLAQQGTNSNEDQIANRQYDRDFYQQDRQPN